LIIEISSSKVMNYYRLTFALLFVLTACNRQPAVNEDDYKMDFRFSPVWGQTSICLPDEVQKTIVDDKGALYYDYLYSGPFNGCNISMSAGLDSAEIGRVSQHLYSSKVPVLVTSMEKGGIVFSTDVFAVAPALKNSPEDSCELSRGFRGFPHNDIMIVSIKNRSGKDTTVVPKFCIRSVYPVLLSRDKKSLSIDKRITVTFPDGLVSGIEKPVGSDHLSILEFNSLEVKAGTQNTIPIAVNTGSKAVQLAPSAEEALQYKAKAIGYWNSYQFPYDHISVPDTNIQNLIYSSIRNIYQAREIKKGLPAFQVGPTCYRGLWIIDGSFLLESMTFLGQGKDVRNGIEYMLSFQNKNGSVLLMDSHWKETGIVLWVIGRHAQLTGDMTWLGSKWENVVRAVGFIDTLRYRTMQDKNAPNRGLIPAGFSDGGLGKKAYEFTNVYWSLNGLKSAVDIALMLNKQKEAHLWKAKYDTMFADYRTAAVRSLKTDSCGNRAVPIYMTDSSQIQRGQWAFCHAVFPGKLFKKDDPLMTGTMNMLKCNEREGLVYETGWQDKGVWNYFGSFYAHAWLWMGDGQKAARTMYAMANHASPTLVWREEQPVKTVKSRQITGDMPHNWASAEFIRMIRHFIALERGQELHLFEGLPPTWIKPGMRTSLKGVYTEFGILDVDLTISEDGQRAGISADLNSSGHQMPSSVVVHLDVLKGAGKTITLKPVFPLSEIVKL
jgi:hypothetical protein